METISGSIASIIFITTSPMLLGSIFNKWKNKGKTYKNIEQVGRDAEEVVKKKDARKVLCPALQSVSNDAYEIAKVITPILVPLVLAGTIAIPLNPLLFATIALVIARMGIASVCVDYKKNQKQKMPNPALS